MKSFISKIKSLKTEIIVAGIIRTLFVLSIIVSLINKNYMNAFIAAFTLFLTFLPFIIARKSQINLPPSFQIVILMFIFAANYLGELKFFYEKYWWWDKMLHTLSGIILGFAGFLLIYIINGEKRLKLNLSPFFVALFSFTFALSMGALWEIYEFTMDSLFGFNMQRSSLNDTMWDLIVDTVGAIIACTYGFIYEKNRRDGIFKKLFLKFIKLNQHIFNDNIFIDNTIDKNIINENHIIEKMKGEKAEKHNGYSKRGHNKRKG